MPPEKRQPKLTPFGKKLMAHAQHLCEVYPHDEDYEGRSDDQWENLAQAKYEMGTHLAVYLVNRAITDPGASLYLKHLMISRLAETRDRPSDQRGPRDLNEFEKKLKSRVSPEDIRALYEESRRIHDDELDLHRTLRTTTPDELLMATHLLTHSLININQQLHLLMGSKITYA